ncbi:MAG TPA: glycosyltransferase family 4 protein [Verrucomicrobiae bacterium]|nr:glycosyltransferase family 4 protein [Verrucomicrobiae bacterium]
MKAKTENASSQAQPKLTVAWISDFPLEWLPDLPEPLRLLPKQHPATWEMVLLSELEKNPALQIHVLILRKEIEKDFRFERNGVVFHVLKVLPGLRAPSLFWLDTFLINRALKKIKPDLVHAWGMEKGAATVASRINYPNIVTLQGLFSWLAEISSASRYVRFIGMLERSTFKRVQIATTESKFGVCYLKSRYPQLDVVQAEHAPNLLFHKIERQPRTIPIRFVYIGSLSYAKGTDLLIRALNHLRTEIPFELVLISSTDQNYLQKLKEMTSHEIWSRIEIKTHLHPEQVARELSLATMLVFPTRADTSPNAVKESVVAGVPVIGSGVGGIPDYVFPNLNGLLFEAGNLQALTQAIRSACEHPNFRKGLVNDETLKRTREYLSPKRMGENFLSIYETVLAKKTRPARLSF